MTQEDVRLELPAAVDGGVRHLVVVDETGKPVCQVLRGELTHDERDRLVRAFSASARGATSLRRTVVNYSDSAAMHQRSGSLLAGAFDARDQHANHLLAGVGARRVPLRHGPIVCRTTAFTLRHPKKWARVLPVIERVAGVHSRLDPDRYALQESYVRDRVAEVYRIAGTAYTTVTANYNTVTRVHIDRGDFAEGSGVILVSGGGFSGGHLCFPRYGVAVELRPGDVCVCDVHEWHGNLPLTVDEGHRLSVVLYARAKLGECRRVLEPALGLSLPLTPPTPHEVRHAQYLVAVAAYARAHGGRTPPPGARVRGLAVGDWCHNRRTDKREGVLSEARISEIERAVPGWQWDPARHDLAAARRGARSATAERWDACIGALEAYVAVSHAGTLPRAEQVVLNLPNLSKWIDNRRRDRGQHDDDPERRRRILALLLLPNDGGPRRAPPRSVSDGRPPFQVAVPTFDRARAIQTKTLALLHRYRIDPGTVSIFVADAAQAAEYRGAMLAKRAEPHARVFADRLVVVGRRGIRTARLAIRAHYAEGVRVVSIDDDVPHVLRLCENRPDRSNGGGGHNNKRRRVLEPVSDLRDIVCDGFMLCAAHGTRLWGVYPVKNALFMGTHARVGLCFVAGALFGVVNSPHDDRVAITLDAKEDHELSLMHYTADGAVVRLDYATFDTTYDVGQGGLRGSRTREGEDEAASALCARYPGLVAPITRGARAELRYLKK